MYKYVYVGEGMGGQGRELCVYMSVWVGVCVHVLFVCEVGNTFDFRFSLLDRSRPRDLPIDCTEQVFLKLSRFRKIDARQTQNPCFQGAASSPAYPRYPFPTPFPERTRRGHPYSHSHMLLSQSRVCQKDGI